MKFFWIGLLCFFALILLAADDYYTGPGGLGSEALIVIYRLDKVDDIYYIHSVEYHVENQEGLRPRTPHILRNEDFEILENGNLMITGKELEKTEDRSDLFRELLQKYFSPSSSLAPLYWSKVANLEECVTVIYDLMDDFDLEDTHGPVGNMEETIEVLGVIARAGKWNPF